MDRHHKNRLTFIPTIGVALFAVLYVVAAALYPGGSAAHLHATSFSIRHNYWCDLLNEHAINGAPNPGRPVTIAAMFILCGSLCMLWYYVARSFQNAQLRRAVLITGIIAFAAGNLLFTPHHDAAIHVAAAAGLISYLLIFFGLVQQGHKALLAHGIVITLLGGVNYYIWASQQFTGILPLLQKVTFLLTLLWFVALNRKVI